MEKMPPQIKLLVLDIDGTLLTPEKQITTRTKATIEAAQQAGILITLATGRHYHNTEAIASVLGLNTPLIVCDGALLIERPHGTILHTQSLDASIAQQAVDILVRHSLQPVVHHIINSSCETVWTGPTEFDTDSVIPYLATCLTRIRRLPHSTLCIGQPHPLRVVAFAREEEVIELISEVSSLDYSWDTIKYGNYGTAEMAIMHTHCSKASGIIALAKHLGIPLEQVMAIGDNNNDTKMLQVVGWGVAMGHAPDAVKSIADAITTSNVEDGAALAIERYALCRASTCSNSFNRDTCL